MVQDRAHGPARATAAANSKRKGKQKSSPAKAARATAEQHSNLGRRRRPPCSRQPSAANGDQYCAQAQATQAAGKRQAAPAAAANHIILYKETSL